MRLLGAFLRVLVAGALGAPPAPAPEARETASAESHVLTFREIWNRSFCRPLEQLVDVITEFPNEVEYIFRPSCVSLQRCGGCCGDEGLRCVPVETNTVTMQLLKIKPNGEAPYVEMTFTEHKQCECRPRQDLMKLGRRRSKGRDAAPHAGSPRSALALLLLSPSEGARGAVPLQAVVRSRTPAGKS
ncbi:placenta growth factor isoform X2 [Colius striatus]|uniref:placenta growth factor isoform X2 n=1 Tax=Colius striatus TaxID=57412 RepID=UPI002B1E56AF|nr:placenta growth factor isoform X2 [Colius striatus]